MDEKTRDEAIKLALTAIVEWAIGNMTVKTMDNVTEMLRRIAREEQMPAEAR